MNRMLRSRRAVLQSLLVFALMAQGGAEEYKNVSIYNYSQSRVVMHHNGTWVGILEPNEYRYLSVPWDITQTFDFYRYPSGNINAAYHYSFYVSKFRETQEIRVTERDLP